MINGIYGTPVFVTELEVPNTDKMIEVLESQDNTKGVKNNWFGDSDGELNRTQLHNLPEFEDFNKAIEQPVKEYLYDVMSKDFYRDAKINIYVQKSWGVRLKEDGAVHSHRHCNSHISLVYYLQTPEGSAALQFPTDNNYDKYNPFATVAHDYVEEIGVKSGMLVIFPSSTLHQAVNNHTTENRYSISYDLMVTTEEARELITLDPKFWKQLG